MVENGIKQAVILAGGQGIRLRPLTNDRPKPMVLIKGRPFLEYLIELLRENGITDVVLLLGYLPDVVINHFGDGSRFGVRITYSVGAVDDETGTRVRNAKNLLKNKFLLMYCDNYWPLDLSKMIRNYREMGVSATTTVYTNRDCGGEYGCENNVLIADNGRILLYDKTRKDTRLNGVDIGFFLLDRSVLGLMPDGNFSFESEILPALAARNDLGAYRADHPYYPITTPDLIREAELFLEPKRVIFLDRDGVINRKAPPHEYIKNWEEFEFLPDAITAMQLLGREGYCMFLVTNQRGISRGLMTEGDLGDIHRRMERLLAENGVVLGGIYYCPHGLEDGCYCRKPKPGMFLRVAREHHIDLTKAVFIGDDECDSQAGEAAGCRTILVEPSQNLLAISKSLTNTWGK